MDVRGLKIQAPFLLSGVCIAENLAKVVSYCYT